MTSDWNWAVRYTVRSEFGMRLFIKVEGRFELIRTICEISQPYKYVI